MGTTSPIGYLRKHSSVKITVEFPDEDPRIIGVVGSRVQRIRGGFVFNERFVAITKIKVAHIFNDRLWTTAKVRTAGERQNFARNDFFCTIDKSGLKKITTNSFGKVVSQIVFIEQIKKLVPLKFRRLGRSWQSETFGLGP